MLPSTLRITYAPAEFEVAMPNSFEDDAFTKKTKNIIWPLSLTLGSNHMKCCPVPSTLCDLHTCKVWRCYVEWLRRRCIYNIIPYLIFDLDLPKNQGHSKCCPVPSTSCYLCTYAPVKFEVNTPNGKGGDAFTNKYIIWPLTLTQRSRSHKILPSYLHIMWYMYLQSLRLLRPTV